MLDSSTMMGQTRWPSLLMEEGGVDRPGGRFLWERQIERGIQVWWRRKRWIEQGGGVRWRKWEMRIEQVW